MVWTIAWSCVLVGLSWATFVNASGSRALIDAIEAESRGEFLAAMTAATEHLARRPWSIEASRVMARCLSRLDFAEQAEPYYDRAGRWLGVEDLRYRAYGLTRANLRERALRAFDEVLRLEPDDVASLRLKAGLLISMTRWNDVAEIGRRLSGAARSSAVVDGPVSVGAHWTFRPREVASIPTIGATLEGIAYHNQGETEEAVVAFERALRLDPNLVTMPLDRRLFWSQFGEDLLKVGRATDLIRDLGDADEGRLDPSLIAILARAYTQLGSIDEAESCWRKVMSMAPDNASAWLSLGRIEAGKGRDEEAARLLKQAATLAPESVDAAYNLGLTYRRLGRSVDAAKWEREAARLRLRFEEKTRAASTPTAAPQGPAS